MTPTDPLDGCWVVCERHEFKPSISSAATLSALACPDCIRASMLAYGRKVAGECDLLVRKRFSDVPTVEAVVREIRRKYGLDEEKSE